MELETGWNLIGSVSQVYDFSNPQDQPDQSVTPGSLYAWRAKGYSYQATDRIQPGQGYWVLALRDCQLTVGGETNVPTAPQVLAEPEILLALKVFVSIISAPASKYWA